MAQDSKLQNLVSFLRSVIPPAQIVELIELLKEGATAPTTLDPELTPKKAVPVQAPIQVPAGLDEILKEMSEAYSEAKFASPSAGETQMVKNSFPGFVEKFGAYQGRHLVKMLREKLGI